jgi:(2Fe-2S) ferredoxin
MLSASNIPVPEGPEVADSTTVLILPAFTIVDNVTPATVPDLITHIINAGPTNTDPLTAPSKAITSTVENSAPSIPKELQLKTRPCPHNYLILLCSQKTRDARCGQSAPLLRKEFERHLRPLGLYRDLHDERPGGVGIYFISHVGGHKFSANLMIYRRASAPKLDGEACETEKEEHKVEEVVAYPDGEGAREVNLGAAQCIWIARVRPEDCENIVRYTVLQGKVLKPDYQLRGGFDRSKQLISW